jgi:hypothetical protein
MNLTSQSFSSSDTSDATLRRELPETLVKLDLFLIEGGELLQRLPDDYRDFKLDESIRVAEAALVNLIWSLWNWSRILFEVIPGHYMDQWDSMLFYRRIWGPSTRSSC